MGHGDFFFEKWVEEYFGLRNADLGSTFSANDDRIHNRERKKNTL